MANKTYVTPRGILKGPMARIAVANGSAWPFLGDRVDRSRQGRSREEILNDLLRSNESIVLNLEELRRRAATGA